MANVRSDVRPLHLRWQPTLMSALGDTPTFDASFASARRVELDDSAWVEHVPGWVGGAETLFEDIVEHAPWEHRTVRMYDRMVDEPRLTAWYGQALADANAPAIFGDMLAALSDRYDRTFDSVGAALYRDGRDSVAWHGDRVDPNLLEPIVAIVSLGSARTLRMRAAMAARRHDPVPVVTGRPLRDGRNCAGRLAARGTESCSCGGTRQRAVPPLDIAAGDQRLVTDLELAPIGRERSDPRLAELERASGPALDHARHIAQPRRDADPQRLQVGLLRGPHREERAQSLLLVVECAPRGMFLVVEHPGRERVDAVAERGSPRRRPRSRAPSAASAITAYEPE